MAPQFAVFPGRRLTGYALSIRSLARPAEVALGCAGRRLIVAMFHMTPLSGLDLQASTPLV
jgi:hypothetical protein